MNETIIGSFIFRTDENGLIGRYTNILELEDYNETAIRRDTAENGNNDGGFVGQYNSRWDGFNTERGGEAILNIDRFPGSENKYILIWHNDGQIVFRGEGFLTEKGNLLVGHYTN